MNPATASSTLIPTVQPIIVNVPQPASATDFVAWAGFVLALLLGAFEIYKYINNKPKLKITTRYNQEIMKLNSYGDITKEASGKTFWSIDVANVGSKPVKIISLALNKKGTKKMYMVTKDFVGHVNPYVLVEGDSHSYTIPDEIMDPKTVPQVNIADATGKVYKQKVKYK